LICSFTLHAQQANDKIHYPNLVEAYYNKDTHHPIYIYDSVNGKIIETLRNIDNTSSWYKIAIIDHEYGWFKIKNIQRLPNEYANYKYENYWVKASDFLVNIHIYDETHRVYLYDEPSEISNRIHKIDSYQVAEITEISDLWALVNFEVGKKVVSGWIKFKNQCAYPWTTCPK